MRKIFTGLSILALASFGIIGAASTASASEIKHANIEAWTPKVAYQHCELVADHNPTHQGAEWTLESSTLDSATYSVAALQGYVLWSSGEEVASPTTVTVPVSNKPAGSCTDPKPKIVEPIEPTITYPTSCATEGGQVTYPETGGQGTYALVYGGGGMHAVEVKETASEGYVFPKNSTSDWQLHTMRGLPAGCYVPTPTPTPTPPAPAPVDVIVTDPVSVTTNTYVDNTATSQSSANASATGGEVQSTMSTVSASVTGTSSVGGATTPSISTPEPPNCTQPPTADAKTGPTFEQDSADSASHPSLSSITPAPASAQAATAPLNWDSVVWGSVISLLILCLTSLAMMRIARK